MLQDQAGEPEIKAGGWHKIIAVSLGEFHIWAYQ